MITIRYVTNEDCGNLDIFYPGFEQPTELLLSKEL